MKFIETLRENTRVSSVWLCRAKSTHLTKAGKAALEAAGLVIPFPQRDVHLIR